MASFYVEDIKKDVVGGYLRVTFRIHLRNVDGAEKEIKKREREKEKKRERVYITTTCSNPASLHFLALASRSDSPVSIAVRFVLIQEDLTVNRESLHLRIRT